MQRSSRQAIALLRSPATQEAMQQLAASTSFGAQQFRCVQHSRPCGSEMAATIKRFLRPLSPPGSLEATGFLSSGASHRHTPAAQTSWARRRTTLTCVGCRRDVGRGRGAPFCRRGGLTRPFPASLTLAPFHPYTAYQEAPAVA